MLLAGHPAHFMLQVSEGRDLTQSLGFRSHARPPSHKGLGAAPAPSSLSGKTTSPELRALKLSFSLQGISVVPLKTFF